MDPVTFITLIAGVVSILGFLYFILIGQKSVVEWWAERREKHRKAAAPAGAVKPDAPTAPAETKAANLVGQSLGPYQIVEQIGAGGMGTVYKAYQPSMDRYVAIKVLPAQVSQDAQFIKRFQREAKAIARLEHAHILPAYDFGEQGGVTYIVMRYVNGGTLRDRLHQGPLPVDEIVRVMEQVGGALDYAHWQGMIHRDVKPGNILLDVQGDVFLGDFGLARVVAPAQPAITSGAGLAVGTPSYMSPEQGQGLKADHRSDIYSLGVVLYEMVTGRLPYEAETPIALVLKHINDPVPRPRALIPGLPEGLERVTLKAMAKNPADRYQSVGDMVADLSGMGSAPTVPAMPLAQPAEPPTRLLDMVEPTTPRTPTDQLPPFLAGPPITHPGRFFGRERELKRLFNLLKRPPLQNAAIIGPRRSGKTSLLHYLKNVTTAAPEQLRPGQRSDWLPRPESYRWLFLDFQDPRFGSREELLRYLLLCLNLPLPDPCNLDRFLSVVRRGLQTPTVILFDEIGVALERYPELDNSFWEALRSLATNQAGGNLAFILASHSAPDQLARQSNLGSPFFNIFGYTTTLGPLAEPEARELISTSPISFPETDIEWILAQAGRWPILLQILCRERLVTLEEGEAGETWREDGLRQMAPFQYLLGEGVP